MLAEPPPKPTKNDYHVERSRFLDAFALLEETLNRMPAPATDELLKEIRALRLIRNDLVHSQLKFVSLEGQLQAIVINSKEADSPARAARLLKLADFQPLLSQLDRLKKTAGAG